MKILNDDFVEWVIENAGVRARVRIYPALMSAMDFEMLALDLKPKDWN
jgi:hypothetical protein